MKRILLLLGLLVLSENAAAVCSGGFDGADSSLQGCSEMGGLGDLIYKRDANGLVLGKRSEAEIKSYLISTVEDRLKGRGVTMKDKNGKPSVTVNDNNIVFERHHFFSGRIQCQKGRIRKGTYGQNRQNAGVGG